MSTKRDDLFRLIQSMSRTEKRYFKMESKKAGDKTSNHVKLFDAINKLEEYDEEVLKKKLKKEKFIKHLSAEKGYLYQAVLKSIRNYRGDQSIFAQIKTMVIDANYLMERSLNDQAERVLNKAAKLAEKIDDTISLLEINFKKQLLAIAHIKGEHKQKIRFLMKEKNEIIALLLNKLEIRDILNKVGVAMTENNSAQIPDFIKGKESILDNTQQSLSFFLNYWTYSIKSQFHKGLGEWDNLAEVRLKIVELWNQNTSIKEEFFHHYLFDLTNYSSASASQNQLDKAIEYLQILENEKPRNSFHRIFIFEKVTIKKLKYYMTIGDFEKVRPLVPDIELALEKLQIRKSSNLTIKSNIAILYFCLEDFPTCLKWANKIIDTPNSTHRMDIQHFIRLLAIVAQIEIGESYETIDNFRRATQRFFQKKDMKNINQANLILLDYFWKYYISPENQQKDLLNQFKLAIEDFYSHPIQKQTLGLEEFHFWIRSKLEKKPFVQLVKESNGPR